MQLMRFLPALAFSVVLTAFSGKNNQLNPFSALRYDKVVAYDFNGEHEMPLVRNGKVAAEIWKKATLSQKQIDYITGVLCDTLSYGNGTAACFEPHLGLVFYAKDSILAHVEVCLTCNSLSSSTPIPAETYYRSEEITATDTLVFIRNGFSKQGRKRINKLVKELDFSHQLEKGMFDE